MQECNKNKQSKSDKAAERFKNRGEKSSDYDMTPIAQERPIFPSDFAFDSLIYESEYKQVAELKKELVNTFEGVSLQDALPGQVGSNQYGTFYLIQENCSISFKKADIEKCRQLITSNLKLIRGIGPVWEKKLKNRGYRTIGDLRTHPRWNLSANKFMNLIESNEIHKLQNWLEHSLPKSHPLIHYFAGFYKEEDFVILDIETLGFFGRAIILLGIAKPRNNGVSINQFLLKDISDEPGALGEFISRLDQNSALISYNGRAFDLPFIQERLNFYGIDASFNNPHFDLLHFARRAWRDHLPNFQLETIEKFFGIQRDIDVPGTFVPEFYETYLKSENVGPLVAIVDHNKQDLITLCTIFSKLYEVWNL